jgi:hypothetical protein
MQDAVDRTLIAEKRTQDLLDTISRDLSKLKQDTRRAEGEASFMASSTPRHHRHHQKS